MSETRFDRNERLFGKDGQARLQRTRIAVMGAGGLGSHVVAQTALLGVGSIAVVDCEEISESNRNRYIGVWRTDPIPGSPKVEVAKRHINLIDPEINVTTIHAKILSEATLQAIKDVDYVFGCVDNDGTRFLLNEACLAYKKPLIDLAADTPEPDAFGGRISVIDGMHGCLDCLEILDKDDVRRFLSSKEMREHESAAYGIDPNALAEIGPSVVSVNGVVASLGVTAFMAISTKMMKLPYTTQNYYGEKGIVTRTCKTTTKSENCHYCKNVRGRGDGADLERYFRKSVT